MLNFIGGDGQFFNFFGFEKMNWGAQRLLFVFFVGGGVIGWVIIGSETEVRAEIDQKKGELRLSRHMLVVEQVENPSNQIIVWVKEAPERFEPRVVTYEPLDGVSVAVTSGLSAGDRVVTQGASLLNQVR